MSRLRDIRLFRVQATARTIWLFLRVRRGDLTGWGEATLEGQEDAVGAVATGIAPGLEGLDNASPHVLWHRLPFETLPEAAFSSALMQAVADIEARQAGQPLWQHLGGHPLEHVPVYANINRRTRDRSPGGMAQSARDALSRGHRAFKIAPFDEVAPTLTQRGMRAAMDVGLARIDAVRGVLGPDTPLMVDCHWRFDTDGAHELIAACAPFGLYWVECPIAERLGTVADLVGLRRAANAVGTRLAGLETQIRVDGFRPYLKAGAYDVMMPDVKYAGGPCEMLRIAEVLAASGVLFSPHNPSGPVAHAHSVHLCAALPESGRLEMQFDETPLFDGLGAPAVQAPACGAIDPAPLTPGLGLAVSETVLTSIKGKCDDTA